MNKDEKKEGNSKAYRIFDLSTRLMNNELLKTEAVARQYGMSTRSIQRDFDDLKVFFTERSDHSSFRQELIYDYNLKGYRLDVTDSNNLTNGEALAVSKVLLESRAFTRDEIHTILDKIINGCIPCKDQARVHDLINNEEFYYIPTHNSKPAMDQIWTLGCAIKEQKIIEVQYTKQDGSLVQRDLKPLAIMFSEFYFYLLALIKGIENDERVADKPVIFPTFYRIDRINAMKVTDEHFMVPYKDKFQEGEFRKRIQFMYGGELRKVRFEYTGPNVEAVLDRLPTAVIEKEEKGVYTISAEVYGNGVEMWMKGQGNRIKWQ